MRSPTLNRVVRFVEAALEGLYAEDHQLHVCCCRTRTHPMAAAPGSALANWCQSFLAGLGGRLESAGVSMRSEGTSGRDAPELVRDFAAIAELDTQLGEDDPEADQETDFVELDRVRQGRQRFSFMSLSADAGDDPKELTSSAVAGL